MVQPADAPGILIFAIAFLTATAAKSSSAAMARAVLSVCAGRRADAQTAIVFKTLGGVIEPRLLANGEVSVDMGAPQFDPAAAAFEHTGLGADGRARASDVAARYRAAVMIAVLSMGNPHAVQTVRDVEPSRSTTDGPLDRAACAVSDRVNAGFMQIVDRHRIRLRVWERGAGETLACGTGACAAVVSGIRRGLLDTPVTVLPAAAS